MKSVNIIFHNGQQCSLPIINTEQRTCMIPSVKFTLPADPRIWQGCPKNSASRGTVPEILKRIIVTINVISMKN